MKAEMSSSRSMAHCASISGLCDRFGRISSALKFLPLTMFLCVAGCDDAHQKGKWVTGNVPRGRIATEDSGEILWLDIYGQPRAIPVGTYDNPEKLIEVRLEIGVSDPYRDRYYLSAGCERTETEIFLWDNRGRDDGLSLIQFDRQRETLTLINGETIKFKPGFRLEGQIIPDWAGVENWSVTEIPTEKEDAP